jgi:hypothetical protein
MAGAFDLTGPEAAQNFAEMAEDLLFASQSETATNAAGHTYDKSLAERHLEAKQAEVAATLASFHSFHVRPGDHPEWPAGFDPNEPATIP